MVLSNKLKLETPPSDDLFHVEVVENYDPSPFANNEYVSYWEEAANENKEIYDAWGINPRRQLPQWCADYYVLNSLKLDFPEDSDIATRLALLINEQANEFAAYLNMAIGGEVRHALCESNLFMGIYNGDNRHSRDHETYESIDATPAGHELLKLIELESGSSRNVMWSSWYKLWHKYGIDVLNNACIILNKPVWRAAFGGGSWARVCHVLINYLTGTDSKQIFVDTVWALEHNGGVVLDKVYRIRPTVLMLLLNSGFEGDLVFPLHTATPSVRQLYRSKKGETSCQDKFITSSISVTIAPIVKNPSESEAALCTLPLTDFIRLYMS